MPPPPSPLARAMSRRFEVADASPFEVVTNDGVRLIGTRLGDADPAILLCHGFSGWHTKARSAMFAEAFARWCTVYAFDFRGHGQSAGETTFGALEVHDIAAVLERARSGCHGPVATFGWSMGGVPAIRHAALVGGIDAVVSISAPARWDGH